ncbi:MAG: hypothetical protein CMH54_15520 [Myxococcales bacterium]|nr:hypothetical protein [Myxococcales bacterium]
MARLGIWLVLALFATSCGVVGEDPAASLGSQLPGPNTVGISSMYESDEELDPAAKADALKVVGSFPEIYAETKPPPAGSRLVAEWAPGSSVLVAWREDFAAYFFDLIVAVSSVHPTWIITANVAESKDLEALLLVSGATARNLFFLEYEHEAFWARDFGPWSVVDPNGVVHFVDPIYYATRYRDDAVPTLLAPYFEVEVFRPDLDAEGGNIMTNGAGLCVTTSRLAYNNPPLFEFEVADLLGEWLGCLRTEFLEPLDDERTGHVDLLAKFVAADHVVVSQYDPETDPENARITDDAAAHLGSLQLTDGRPMRVTRIPMPSSVDKVFRTYTNALQTDTAIFVPVYDGYDKLNAEALDIYRSVLPEGTVVFPIPASAVIEWGGAVHCTTMQMHHGAVVAEQELADEPVAWAVPDGAFGEVAKAQGEEDVPIIRTVEGFFSQTASLGSFEIYIDLEGRMPNQVRITLRNGAVAAVLHDGSGLSSLDEMPDRFTTDAFVGHTDTGVWQLTIEVLPTRSDVGLHRWYIRPEVTAGQ